MRATQAKAQSLGLGLKQTAFVDPAGVAPGNRSTATEVAKIAAAAARYPEIGRISSESGSRMTMDGHARVVSSSNQLVGTENWDVQLSKTGRTREAGSCLTLRLKVGGKPYTLVLLDADDVAHRQLDGSQIHARLAGVHSS